MTIITTTLNKLLPHQSAEIPFDEFSSMTTAEVAKAASLHRQHSDQMLYLVVPSHRPGLIESHRFEALDGVIYTQADGTAKIAKDRGGILKIFHEMPREVAAVRRINEERQHLSDLLTQVEKLQRIWADSSTLHKPSLLEKDAKKLPDELSLSDFHEGLLFVILAQNGTETKLREIERRLKDRQGEIEAFLAGN